jgi:hypothetical protein
MGRSVKVQIRSGLRLGAGLGVFLVAAILLGHTRTRLEVLSSYHQNGWSDWVVWLEVILGVGLLFSAVHVWYQWLAGCLLFGIVKAFMALVTGTAVFPMRQLPPTRTVSLMVVVYCTVSLLLLIRFMETKLTMADRVAVTVYFLCFLPPRSSFPSVWEIVGFVGLLASWVVYRWREGRAPTSGAPVSAQ